ncbi:MAG: hypothetical protein AAB695_02155 [Patescibacteria group bacterium]
MEEPNNLNLEEVIEPKGGSLGPILAGVVILAVIIFGVLYFMDQREGSQAFNEEVNAINSQDTSDEAASIEADLNSTDIENLDAELNAF